MAGHKRPHIKQTKWRWVRGTWGDISNEMYLSVVLLNWLSAPAEIPIYVYTILYSCSFNNPIHYRATVINKVKKKKKKTMQLRWEKLSGNIYIYAKKNNEVKDNDHFCRKWNKSSWLILLQADKAWLPLIVLQQLCHCAAISTSAEVSEIRISWSSRQLTRQLWCCKGGYGFWLFLQGTMRSVPVNVRTLFTPQSSHLCHHFSPHHAESCLVWSAFWVSLILSGLTMKADLLCSS